MIEVTRDDRRTKKTKTCFGKTVKSACREYKGLYDKIMQTKAGPDLVKRIELGHLAGLTFNNTTTRTRYYIKNIK